jgi:hypothetical protein
MTNSAALDTNGNAEKALLKIYIFCTILTIAPPSFCILK